MAITTLTGSNGTYKFNPDDNGNILGRGGMGIVYKGADQNNQPVAIKMMHRAISAHINNIVQAKREAAIQIKHKNLIRMLDFIEKDGDHHIISEFIDGETLRNKLDKSPHGLNLQLSTDITTNILEGLETLHSYNVVHRDIDPTNIMICKDGTAKLMDFGIAKISGYDLQTLTGTGAFKGKYQYAAPEQIKGEKNKINNTTDIYAVGITFYEMLSGILPFNGDSEFDLMKKHIEDALPNNSKIPNNLFGLITKATAKNQDDRYKSATEFLEDLGHEKPLKNAKEYFERAEKYREAKNWVKAIENYDIVIAKNVKFVNARLWRAFCENQLGRYTEAIKDCTFDIDGDPTFAYYYYARAYAYSAIGEIGNALGDYKQAIKLDPEGELYKKNYASFLETNNLHQQLIDDISEEIKLDPKNPELYLKRAFAEFDIKDYKNFNSDLRIAQGLESKIANFILKKIPIYKFKNFFLWPITILIGILILTSLFFWFVAGGNIVNSWGIHYELVYPWAIFILIILPSFLFYGGYRAFHGSITIEGFDSLKAARLIFSMTSDIKDMKLKERIQIYLKRNIDGYYSSYNDSLNILASIPWVIIALLILYGITVGYIIPIVESIKRFFDK